MVHFITFQGIGSFRLVSGRVSPAFKSIVFWGFRDSAGDFAIFWEPQRHPPESRRSRPEALWSLCLFPKIEGKHPKMHGENHGKPY